MRRATLFSTSLPRPRRGRKEPLRSAIDPWRLLPARFMRSLNAPRREFLYLGFVAHRYAYPPRRRARSGRGHWKSPRRRGLARAQAREPGAPTSTTRSPPSADLRRLRVGDPGRSAARGTGTPASDRSARSLGRAASTLRLRQPHVVYHDPESRGARERTVCGDQRSILRARGCHVEGVISGHMAAQRPRFPQERTVQQPLHSPLAQIVDGFRCSRLA